MKIIVESYNNNQKLHSVSSKAAPQINNPTILSIIDNAVARNNSPVTASNKSKLSNHTVGSITKND